MDTLTVSNLEDTLHLEEKLVETFKKNWDKMNMTACGLIKSYLNKTSSIMCCMRLSQERCGRSSKEVSNEEHQGLIASEEEALPLSVEERTLH